MTRRKTRKRRERKRRRVRDNGGGAEEARWLDNKKIKNHPSPSPKQERRQISKGGRGGDGRCAAALQSEMRRDK